MNDERFSHLFLKTLSAMLTVAALAGGVWLGVATFGWLTR